jgi:tetratricopeptide (TPR) repeat protein
MASPSNVLYALHNSIEPRGFENLCVDLLVREGHSRIIPGGKSRDLGRDAEVRYWTDSKSGSARIVFQFSMEAKWESKLRSDVNKILINCKTVERIVFVSSRSISIEKQKKLRLECQSDHQIDLEIFDEGWFRVRLEEEHTDLALKHLGVSIPPTPGFHAALIKIHGLTDGNQEEMLRHTSAESLRATFTAQTKADPTNWAAWKALAHVCDHMRDYDHALFCVSKALKCSIDGADRLNVVALRASITAEKGIASNSRLLLKSAEEQFLAIAIEFGRSVDYYNLANVHGALGKQGIAEAHYRRCLDIDPEYAQAWNNLGTLLIKMKRREEGLACFDRALQLKPNMIETLCTKANVLLMGSDGSKEAICLMDRALELDPDIEIRWPHFHYWKAMALCQESRLVEALGIVEDRLERRFDCPFLGRLGCDILSRLWRGDPAYIAKAEEFFRLRIDPTERNYRAVIEVLDLLSATDREDEAWRTLGEFLDLEELSIQRISQRIPLSIGDLTDSFASMDYYRNFRSASSLVDYARMLDDLGLHPHGDVPEILFHLLLPCYFKMGLALSNSESKIETDNELNSIIEIYQSVSRTFAAFGGALLAPTAPESSDRKIEMVAKGALAGLDIPLIEVSRLLGYLFGIIDREIPERYETALVESTSVTHEDWLKVFFAAVDADWRFETLPNESSGLSKTSENA